MLIKTIEKFSQNSGMTLSIKHLTSKACSKKMLMYLPKYQKQKRPTKIKKDHALSASAD